jgi:hypothetical protein
VLRLTAPGGAPVWIEPSAIEALTPPEQGATGLTGMRVSATDLYRNASIGPVGCVVYCASGQSYRVQETDVEIRALLAAATLPGAPG